MSESVLPREKKSWSAEGWGGVHKQKKPVGQMKGGRYSYIIPTFLAAEGRVDFL